MADAFFRIHHISDVHIGASHYHASNNVPLPAANGKYRNTEAYLGHLGSLDPSAFPDLVIVSGDMTSFASQEEMNAAEDFLAKVADLDNWQRRKVSPGAPRILMIPGNHDLDWSKETAAEKHERFGRMSESLRGAGVLSSKYFRTRQFPWVDFGDEANLFVYLLNSTPHGGIKDPALHGIYEVIKEQALRIGVGPEDLKAFSQHVRKDPGFVLYDEIAALTKEAMRVPAGRIKLAVVHHNPNHVPSDDQEVFDTIVNSGALKAALLQAGFHVVLHGHRHIFHTSVESHPASSFPENRCHFVGADSLGCKEEAPFLELLFTRNGPATRASGEVSVAVREYRYSHPHGFGSGVPRCQLPLTKPASQDIGAIVENATPVSEMTPETKAAFLAAWPAMRKIYTDLTPSTNEYEWVEQFHNQLDTYSRIWATALFGPQSITDSQYQKYLRQQYARRLELTRKIPEKVLYYSPDLYKAIIRSRWLPAQELWSGYKMAAQSKNSPSMLEVARIAIVDETIDTIALESLFFDHALCAIPLFVIERKHLEDKNVVNCAIGFDSAENPIKAYAFERASGLVKEQKVGARYELLNTFEQLLSNRKLINANECVGHQRIYKEQADAYAAQ